MKLAQRLTLKAHDYEHSGYANSMSRTFDGFPGGFRNCSMKHKVARSRGSKNPPDAALERESATSANSRCWLACFPRSPIV